MLSMFSVSLLSYQAARMRPLRPLYGQPWLYLGYWSSEMVKPSRKRGMANAPGRLRMYARKQVSSHDALRTTTPARAFYMDTALIGPILL